MAYHRFKACLKGLYKAYDDVQNNFKESYIAGINAEATYTYHNKTMTKEENFPQNFTTKRELYFKALNNFRRAKFQYDKVINKGKGIYKFNNKLTNKFANILGKYREQARIETIHNELSAVRNIVHDFTNTTKDNPCILDIIKKGPSFIPTTSENHDTKDTISKTISDTVESYCSKMTNTNSYKYGNNIALKLNLNHPNVTSHTLQYILDVLEKNSDISIPNEEEPSYSNISVEEVNLIKDLAKNNDIVINTADKNLGFSINHIKWYCDEYNRQLSDGNVYEEIPYANKNDIIRQGYTDLNNLYEKYSRIECLDNIGLEQMITRELDSIKIPTLNITPEVHKLTEKADSKIEHKLKGRPIVNGYATLNTEPSQLLGKLFNNCLDRLKRLFLDKDMGDFQKNEVKV